MERTHEQDEIENLLEGFSECCHDQVMSKRLNPGPLTINEGALLLENLEGAVETMMHSILQKNNTAPQVVTGVGPSRPASGQPFGIAPQPAPTPAPGRAPGYLTGWYPPPPYLPLGAITIRRSTAPGPLPPPTPPLYMLMQGLRRDGPEGPPVRAPLVRKRKTGAEKELEQQAETTTSPVRKRAKKDSVETVTEGQGEMATEGQGGRGTEGQAETTTEGQSGPDQIGEVGVSAGSGGEVNGERTEPEAEKAENEVSAGEESEWVSGIDWEWEGFQDRVWTQIWD